MTRYRKLFYAVSSPFLKMSGAAYRRLRAPRTGTIKVHLGPGQKNYLPGWINVDANLISAKIDVWADLRNPLPFHDGSVSALYSHHVIEHLPDLYAHFREVARVLKPGGVFRIGGPNGDNAAKKFVEGDMSWFSSDFPDNRKSLGGRFANFVFCGHEHLTILTASFLGEIAKDVGLGDVTVCQPVTQTHYPEFIDATLLATEWEDRPECPHTLIIEGRKQ